MRYDTFNRKLTSKDPEAVRIASVLRAAGVKVCEHRKRPEDMKVGETYSIGAIRNAIREYGPEITTLALRCIVESRDGNVGELRGDVIQSAAAALRMFPAWASKPYETVRAFDAISFPILRADAQRLHTGPGLSKIMTTLLAHDLTNTLGAGRSAPNKPPHRNPKMDETAPHVAPKTRVK